MQFGLAFPYNQSRHLPEWARLAEDCGWDGIFLGDAIWTEDPLTALAAAAMTTRRIRLGTMLVPVPLRTPWGIASQALVVDRLSNGRLILGLGTGATWMGWYAFPGTVTAAKARAEMLNETIDILTQLFACRQADYPGVHFPLALSQLDPQYYPPAPVQQPRVPLWAPLIWPKAKSKARILKCDGLFVEQLGTEKQPEAVTPADLAEIKAFVSANRELATPFDYVIGSRVGGRTEPGTPAAVRPWAEAGATWWIEELWDAAPESVLARIQNGPPRR